LGNELIELLKVEIALIDGQSPINIEQSIRDQGLQRLPEFIKKLVNLLTSLEESFQLVFAEMESKLDSIV
jgi:hypothetical protein